MTDKVNALGNSRDAKNETRLYMFRYICKIIQQMEVGVEDVVKSTEGHGDVDQAGPGGNTAQLLYRGGDVALISALLPVAYFLQGRLVSIHVYH